MSPPVVGSSPEAAFDAALEHARHLVPAQGPIGNFIHHNTLHAFQHLPFHTAVHQAASLHSAQGYLQEEQYREALRSGRITRADLARPVELRTRELAGQRDEPLGPFSQSRLEQLVLEHGLSEDELADALSDLTLSERELLGVCLELAPLDTPPHAQLLPRVGKDRTARDLLIAMSARDPAELVNPVLVDFLGAYLDEGMARWAMPQRAHGLLASFVAYLRSSPGSLPSYERRALLRLEQAIVSSHAGTTRALGEPARKADEVVIDARKLALAVLAELGVEPSHFDSYLSRTLLELPGWSGMVNRLETIKTDRGPDAPPVSLLELSAIRLVLDIEAYLTSAAEAGHSGPIANLPAFAARRFALTAPSNERNASHLFDACELTVLSAAALRALGKPFAERVCKCLDEFDEETRRRLLHEAYEHAHLREVLDAIANHREQAEQQERLVPKFQVMFCIDDREEAIRRYFEELDPHNVTYGVAGFFGVAMRFRGIDDFNDAALCPIVVNPVHSIAEAPLPEHEHTLARRFSRRAASARVRFEIADSSRSLLRGFALTPILGVLSAIPLTFSVLFPGAASRLTRWIAQHTLPTPRTKLLLDLVEPPADGEPGQRAASALATGFTIAEQADRVAGTLENIGAIDNFAPLVAVLGHGASTVNNPHHSAYDCGACGGRNGGPNARAFAAMANSPAVRALLCVRNIDIPDSTWFVGGYHDTTTDGVHLSDLELVPPALEPALHQLRAALDEARTMSAYERCRKFEHAPRSLTPRAALRHVEERAVDLSQARPELGHATNAVCIVGRRELSRGLFLDRRSFLVSYDAAIDPELKILERILGAVVPVGAGINLEYYFSTVDNDVWGSGTKLPHNLSGLLGVMEGSVGDLRTGLPRQMIEVHDPVRLLSIIEATPEAIFEVAKRKPEVAELVTKEWVRVASVHPVSGEIRVFDAGEFRPYAPSSTALPTVSSAEDWYRGQLGFLSPVRIVKRRSKAA
jgi:uncharacterized protein YbcC (UPF0753/DUF2309 family)